MEEACNISLDSKVRELPCSQESHTLQTRCIIDALTLVNTKEDHQHKTDTEEALCLPLLSWQRPLWCPDEKEEEKQWPKCSKFLLMEKC